MLEKKQVTNTPILNKMQNLLLKQAFFPFKDRVTGLPTLMSLLPDLEIVKQRLGLIYIDVVEFKRLEALYGRDICDEILEHIAQGLRGIPICFCGKRTTYGLCNLGGDDFLIFVDAPVNIYNYKEEYLELKNKLESLINEAIQPIGLDENLLIHLGYTPLEQRSSDHIGTRIFKAVKEASYAAKHYASALEHENWQLMKEILDTRAIKSVFQPIVSLQTGHILGYEALSRGPAGTVYESPVNLFTAAEEFDCLLELESVCHSRAINKAVPALGENYLFLNVSPILLNSVNRSNGLIQDDLLKQHLQYSHVVVELTERNNIEDYKSLLEELEPYREQGFMIAIDDAGAGYSSLQAIAEVKPEFVKMDLSLVRDVDKDPTKLALVEAFVDFAYKINARIIAEGIETEEELQTLIKLGCDYGQGFLLARPGEIRHDKAPDIVEKVSRWTAYEKELASYPYTILGDLLQYQEAFPADMEVEQLVSYFFNHSSLNGVVVCRDQEPLGLIMRDHLLSLLANPNAYQLLMYEHLESVMDPLPLILPDTTPLDQAAMALTQYPNLRISDYMIVTNNGNYAGIVTVSQILESMASKYQ